MAVSNIQPLPHQLEVVYECFLREPRLRFLLAADPGAGKTIMAGLYMKALILRRAGDRISVVTPANLRPQWTRELLVAVPSESLHSHGLSPDIAYPQPR